MEIDYCKAGRYECEYVNGNFVYVEQGDFAVSTYETRKISSSFPLEYYEGVTIAIDIPVATASLSPIEVVRKVDLYTLKEQLCNSGNCFILRANNAIRHIFSELFSVNPQIRDEYFKLKTLELLLFLSATDMDERISIKQLAREVGIGETPLRLSFQKVFGTTIGCYMRQYRMQAAASLLTRSPAPISEIARQVGYENQSKFAAAFKKTTEQSPIQYRKDNLELK